MMIIQKKPPTAESALVEFLETIEATGGVRMTHKGYPSPLGEPEWTDLGSAYLNGCEALGRKPKIIADGC